MSLTEWLRRKVDQLELEIAASHVFESARPASRADLQELAKKIVIHRYLLQELQRREKHSTVEMPLAASSHSATHAACA